MSTIATDELNLRAAAARQLRVELERAARLTSLLKSAQSSVSEAFRVVADRDQAARLHQLWLAIAREVES